MVDHKTWLRQSWPVIAVVACFVLIELWRLDYNGPSFDEGAYLVAGERTWKGYGISDRYLTWFSGSLAYPVAAYVGYQFGGLLGARLIGVICLAIATSVVSRFAVHVFGRSSGPWAAFVFAGSATTLFTGKLAVYDAPAILCVAVAFLMAARGIRDDDQGQFGWAGVALGLGVVFKYSAAAMALSLSTFILAARARRAISDLAVLAVTFAGTLLLALAPLGSDPVSAVFRRSTVVPRFGYDFSMVMERLAYLGGAPFVLALVGAAIRRCLLGTAGALLLGTLVFPAYHLIQTDPVSIEKHVVFGLVTGAPLAALVMARLWSVSLTRPIAGVLAVFLLAFSGYQLAQLERSFPDIREVSVFLRGEMQPEDKVLANNSWSYRLELMDKLGSPWELADDYFLGNGIAGDLSNYRWFVNEHGSFSLDPKTEKTILGQGNWEMVYASSTSVAGLGPTGTFLNYPVATEVWRQK